MGELLKRLQQLGPVRLVMAYGNSQAGNYASVIAFNAFMTMFPLILGVLAILGLALHSSALQGKVEHSIIGFFPDAEAQKTIGKALTGVKQNAGILGIVSLLGLIWTGTNFFSAMEFALDQVYGIKQRSLVPQRLMGVGMLLIFVVALLLSVGASALAAFIPFAAVGGFVVGALVMMALLFAVYWVVPNRRQTWADVWPGALLSGVLIEVLTLAWPIYTKLMHGFNTYSQSFSLFFLLATWLYFLSVLILLGAVLNHLRLHGEPVPKAEPAAASAAAEDAEGGRPEIEQRARRRIQA